MSPRHIRKSIWLLVPLLALRGLVPAGYMVDATSNGLAIVVCESGIYSAAAQLGSEHHHHHGHDKDASPGQHDHSICPFAIAATGVSTSCSTATIAVAAVEIGRISSEFAVVDSLFGPSRAQQSRAPPYAS